MTHKIIRYLSVHCGGLIYTVKEFPHLINSHMWCLLLRVLQIPQTQHVKTKQVWTNCFLQVYSSYQTFSVLVSGHYYVVWTRKLSHSWFFYSPQQICHQVLYILIIESILLPLSVSIQTLKIFILYYFWSPLTGLQSKSCFLRWPSSPHSHHIYLSEAHMDD